MFCFKTENLGDLCGFQLSYWIFVSSVMTVVSSILTMCLNVFGGSWLHDALSHGITSHWLWDCWRCCLCGLCAGDLSFKMTLGCGR